MCKLKTSIEMKKLGDEIYKEYVSLKKKERKLYDKIFNFIDEYFKNCKPDNNGGELRGSEICRIEDYYELKIPVTEEMEENVLLYFLGDIGIENFENKWVYLVDANESLVHSYTIKHSQERLWDNDFDYEKYHIILRFKSLTNSIKYSKKIKNIEIGGFEKLFEQKEDIEKSIEIYNEGEK